MAWQTAALLGVGFIGGFVSASLMGRRRSTERPSAPPVAPAAAPPVPEAVALACGRLQQLERFKSGFLARSAHELRSPINSIIGLHQLILEDLCEGPEEEKQFVGEAKDAAYKVLQLFDTIIAASKLDIGREIPSQKPIPLAAIFQTIQKNTQLQAANHNLQLTIKDTDLTVLSDLKWLQLLLLTLVDDAISSTQLGCVTLRAVDQPDGQVTIYLHADRPASQLQPTTEGQAYGREVNMEDTSSIYLSTGMVMAIAQQVVQALEGSLAVHAENDDGSVIAIQLAAAA